jgi:hypothetical protein
LTKVAAKKTGIAGQIEDGVILVVTHFEAWLQNIQNNPDAGTVDATSRLFAAVLKFAVISRIHYERSYISL